MTDWLNDRDLAAVRDTRALEKLPADEGAAWRRLWGEVIEVRGRAAGRG
jgi:hypothetical protein